MPAVTPDGLRRLIAVDAALASMEGLHRPSMAKRLGCSPRSIQRDHEVLRALVGDMGLIAYDDLGRAFHWYSDRRRQVFSRWLSDND